MPNIGTASSLGFYFTNFNDNPSEFPNGDFDLGLTGWTTVNTRIRMFGQSTLAGWPTPPDPTPNPFNCTGDATFVSGNSYSTVLSNDVPPGGVQSVQLIQGNMIVNSFALLYGPAIFSNFYVNFNAGDFCEFNYKALPGGDAYNIFAYMVEQTTGAYINLLRAASPNPNTGTGWLKQTNLVPISGAYAFVFVAGSWDATGGTVLGASMLIDNIKRVNPP